MQFPPLCIRGGGGSFVFERIQENHPDPLRASPLLHAKGGDKCAVDCLW